MKRGRPKKQLHGDKKQKESAQQEDESPITRNRTQSKIEYEDKTKNVFIGKPTKDISFIDCAGDVSNTEENIVLVTHWNYVKLSEWYINFNESFSRLYLYRQEVSERPFSRLLL